jgi:hypothetical protein
VVPELAKKARSPKIMPGVSGTLARDIGLRANVSKYRPERKRSGHDQRTKLSAEPVGTQWRDTVPSRTQRINNIAKSTG